MTSAAVSSGHEVMQRISHENDDNILDCIAIKCATSIQNQFIEVNNNHVVDFIVYVTHGEMN
jgi:hypothetical protein